MIFHDFFFFFWIDLWVTSLLHKFSLVTCLDVLYERWGKINPELRKDAGHLLHISVFWWHILFRQQDNHSTTAWAVDMGFLDSKWVLLLWFYKRVKLLWFLSRRSSANSWIWKCRSNRLSQHASRGHWARLHWKEKSINPCRGFWCLNKKGLRLLYTSIWFKQEVCRCIFILIQMAHCQGLFQHQHHNVPYSSSVFHSKIIKMQFNC